MITIRKLNFLTDCYRDFAGDIQAILDELYEVSPWTFEQTFADLLRERPFTIWPFQKTKSSWFFSAVESLWMKLKLLTLLLPKAYQSQGIATSILLKQLAELDGKFS